MTTESSTIVNLIIGLSTVVSIILAYLWIYFLFNIKPKKTYKKVLHIFIGGPIIWFVAIVILVAMFIENPSKRLEKFFNN